MTEIQPTVDKRCFCRCIVKQCIHFSFFRLFIDMLSFCRTPDSPVNLSSLLQTKLVHLWESVRAMLFFSFKEGTCSDEGLMAPCVHARVCAHVCVGAAQRLSLLCLPLSLILRLLQSSPQNRPLIIVWCATGSAVRSYKQRMGVFIAGSRLEFCCIEADHRGEAPIETFSAGREANRRCLRVLSSSFSSPHGSSVWSSLLWAGLQGETATWPRDTLHWSAHKQAKAEGH